MNQRIRKKRQLPNPQNPKAKPYLVRKSRQRIKISKASKKPSPGEPIEVEAELIEVEPVGESQTESPPGKRAVLRVKFNPER